MRLLTFAAALTCVACGPHVIRPPQPAFRLERALEAPVPVNVTVEAPREERIGEHLDGFLRVKQYDYVTPELAATLRDRLLIAARQFGFVTQGGGAALTLQANFDRLFITTRGFLAGDDTTLDVTASIALTNSSGTPIFQERLNPRPQPGDDDDAGIAYAEIDTAIAQWFEALAMRRAQDPQLALALKPVSPAPPGQPTSVTQVTQVTSKLQTPATLLILNLKAVGPVRPHVPTLLTRLLASTLQSVAGLQTVGVDDMEAMLDVERKKDALGCDTTACMAEVGGALGARYVLYGELGVLGSNYSVTLAVLDTKGQLVRVRASRLVRADDDALAAALPGLVEEIVQKLNGAASS